MNKNLFPTNSKEERIMKQTLKNLVNRYKLIFDILGIIIFGLSAFFLKIYKLM